MRHTTGLARLSLHMNSGKACYLTAQGSAICSCGHAQTYWTGWRQSCGLNGHPLQFDIRHKPRLPLFSRRCVHSVCDYIPPVAHITTAAVYCSSGKD
jgi:hypothetical protein